MAFLKDLVFGQSYNEAVDPYRQNYESAKQNIYNTRSKAFDDSEFYQANKDLFAEAEKEMPGLTEAFLAGTSGQGLQDNLNAAKSVADEAYNQLGQAKRANKYNVFGNGILGTLLSPFFGVADIAGDMFDQGGKSLGNIISGVTSGDWNKYELSNRYDRTDSDGFKINDLGQDLGSIGNAVLTVAGGGNLGSAASVGAKALKGAALGGAQNALYNLQQNGEYANGGDVLGDALFGAAVGGALPIAGNALGNIKTKGAQRIVDNSINRTGISPATANDYMSLINQAKSGIGSGLRSFGAGIIPQSTLGKTAAIGGGAALGGFGLSKLFGNNGGNNQNLSDADLATLYNYYYGGGY